MVSVTFNLLDEEVAGGAAVTTNVGGRRVKKNKTKKNKSKKM